MMNVRKALGRTAAAVATIVGSGAIYVACSSCCIRAGSLVLTPDGEVPIEAVEVGDVVLSWDFRTGQLVENRVEATYRKVGLTWVEAVLPSGERLEATHDHQAYDAETGGYVEVGQVQRFARVDAQRALALDAPATRETRYGLATFHDLTLASEPRNYLANGVVVHNKTITPFGKPTTTGPYSAVITRDSLGGSKDPSPIGGIAGSPGPIGDIITRDSLGSGTGTPSPIGAIVGSGPIGGISGGSSGGSTGGGTGGGGTGSLALQTPIPNTGSPVGNEVILLRGTGIVPGIAVTIANRPAVVLGTGSFSGTTTDSLVVRTPTGIAGSAATIVITTPGGDVQTITGGFTYLSNNASRFRAGTDKWYIVTTSGNVLGDADGSGTSDLEEALALANNGVGGTFTGTVNAFMPQLLSFANQFYRNNADGTAGAGGLPISFLSDRDEGGLMVLGANGVISPAPGTAFTPDYVGDYNIMALRQVPDPFGSSGVVGQAIAEVTNQNDFIEGDGFYLNQSQTNGNELGIFTNSHVAFWNSSAIAASQRTLTELAQEFAATLVHEIGHSIGREHTDDAPAAPATVNIMSATSVFDVNNVYAFDDARFTTMLGYMPGPSRRLHAVAFSPRTLVKHADAVVIGTPHQLANGVLTVLWHETLYGQVDATGAQVAIRGFLPTASAGPDVLEPLGRVMFFLQRRADGLWLRDVNATLGLDAPNGAELDLVVRDYLALGQLSGAAYQRAYRERAAASLRSNSAYLRTATLVELSLDRATCRALTPAELAPAQALLTDANASRADRVLAGQLFVHRGDAALKPELVSAALASDDPILIKTLAGALEEALGLPAAASAVRERLISLDPTQAARARVLLGWLRDASAVEFVAQGLADDAQACAAADALGRIGSAAALPGLEQVASDGARSTAIRHCALRAIGQIGGDAARAWLTARRDALPEGAERDAVGFARDYPWTWLTD